MQLVLVFNFENRLAQDISKLIAVIEDQYLSLTGCATTHLFLCCNVSVNSDGQMHDVELARMTSDLLICLSKLVNTVFFKSKLSGVHS